jgi:hypothetical protein
MLTSVFENYFDQMSYCIGRVEALDKEVGLDELFYDLLKDFIMLDSVGTTELLAATRYDNFIVEAAHAIKLQKIMKQK